MLKRELIDSTTIDDGEVLELYSHGRDFIIALGRNELMSTRMQFSEEQLAELTLERLGKETPRILIGGYGMGFTLRKALSLLGERADVVVAEISHSIIDWAEGPMAELTGETMS
ncbi:MAG: spermidine synthase, partial [Pseudomonadota bacterium]